LILPVQEGAREVYACTSHAVFSPPAIERLSSGVFEEVIVTNTIPVAPVGLRGLAPVCIGTDVTRVALGLEILVIHMLI
jgi:hypothetical protein